MATPFEQQLTRLDERLAQRLDSITNEINTDARIKIDIARRDSADRLAAANDELDLALTDLQASAVSINSLQANLATTRETTAKTNGRLEVMEQKLDTSNSRISSLEAELTTSHAEIAASAGRMEVLESDLRARSKQIEALDASLAEAREATTTAISRAQSLEGELKNRGNEKVSIPSIETGPAEQENHLCN